MKSYTKPTCYIAVFFAVVLFAGCKKDKDDDSDSARYLYFTYWSDNTVDRIDLKHDPNSYDELFTDADGLSEPSAMVLTHDGYLIVAEEYTSRILKMKKDGTGDIDVLYVAADGANEPCAITMNINTGDIYWCNYGDGRIMKGSDDGTATPVALYGGAAVIDYPYGIALDLANGKIYVSDFDIGISVGNLNGTGTLETVWDYINFPGIGAPSNLCLDVENGKVYWTDEETDAIVVANMNGTGTPVELFNDSDGINRADGLSIDFEHEKIYWSETKGNNEICRGNLDGSGDKEVLVDNVESYCMVLEL
jgi:DNA-binding beta-propeller fold protein YncE